MIKAKIICDSTNWLDKRLTTYILEYPRYIHAELLTHRVFSKNSASSRAIPIEKMVEMVSVNPAIPIWTEEQKGMKGQIITDQDTISRATGNWLSARNNVINFVKRLSNLKIHKQNTNRLLEPFHHIRIILTGTDFDNWFELRDHSDAHPEIQELAKQMRKEYDESLPIFLEEGEWHLPFGDRMDENKLFDIALKNTLQGFGADGEIEEAILNLKLKISVARCARISYNTFEGEINYEKDIELYKNLVEQRPLHASPSEHQATPPTKKELVDGYYNIEWYEDKDGWKQDRGKYISNLNGWKQLRKLIEELTYKHEGKNIKVG